MKRIRREIRTGIRGSGGVIPLRPSRIIGYEPGSIWRLGAARVTLVEQISTTLVRVRYAADDQLDTVVISQLSPWVDREEQHEPLQRDYHAPEVLSRAQLEYSVVSALVNSGDLSRRAKLHAANSLGISARHLRTKLQRFAEFGTPEAFLPRRTGPRHGTVTIDPRVERLMMETIARELRTSGDLACSDIYPIIEADALGLGLKPPGSATVSRRLRRERHKRKSLPTEIGNELAYRNSPVPGPLSAAGPLSMVEMDHTVTDRHKRAGDDRRNGASFR
jgi:hypothetical protein